MMMRTPSLALLMSVVLGCCSLVAVGESADPAARLKAMMEETALDSPEAGSWHWKIEATVYDFDGKNPKPGSIEIWHSGRNMRTVMALDGEQLTTLRAENRLYRSSGDPLKFSTLEAAFIQLLNPIPSNVAMPSVKLRMAQRKLRKDKLDCVQPTFSMPDIPTYNTDFRLEFCALNDHFVAAFEADDTVIAFGQVGLFRSKLIPATFQITCHKHLILEGKTTALSTFMPAANDFAITPELHPLQLPIHIPSGFGFLLLNHDSPLYPPGAHARNSGGAVSLNIVVDESGNVISYTFAGKADDPELNKAMEDSLTHLIFHPYLINGIPVQVTTSIRQVFGVADSGPLSSRHP